MKRLDWVAVLAFSTALTAGVMAFATRADERRAAQLEYLDCQWEELYGEPQDTTPCWARMAWP